jgi:hypothetical protein
MELLFNQAELQTGASISTSEQDQEATLLVAI